MKLTKYFGQYKKATGKEIESGFEITIDYDPKEDNVESIESVVAYNNQKGVYTDLTAIFTEQFYGELDDIVNGIDWREVYSETKAELKAI